MCVFSFAVANFLQHLMSEYVLNARARANINIHAYARKKRKEMYKITKISYY